MDQTGNQWVVRYQIYVDGSLGQKFPDATARLLDADVRLVAFDMTETQVVKSVGVLMMIEVV